MKWILDLSLNFFLGVETQTCEIQAVILMCYVTYIFQYLLKYVMKERNILYFILIEINHSFLRVLCFLNMLMMHNTDSPAFCLP